MTINRPSLTFLLTTCGLGSEVFLHFRGGQSTASALVMWPVPYGLRVEKYSLLCFNLHFNLLPQHSVLITTYATRVIDVSPLMDSA